MIFFRDLTGTLFVINIGIIIVGSVSIFTKRENKQSGLYTICLLLLHTFMIIIVFDSKIPLLHIALWCVGFYLYCLLFQSLFSAESKKIVTPADDHLITEKEITSLEKNKVQNKTIEVKPSVAIRNRTYNTKRYRSSLHRSRAPYWLERLFGYDSDHSDYSKSITDQKNRTNIERYHQSAYRAVYLMMEDIDRLEGNDFEKFCKTLLEKNGFSEVQITPASGDQGADLLATRDNRRYAIQCKRYSNKLGNRPVQEVYAAQTHYWCDRAVVLTNNYFTESAKELALSTGVLLWDRDVLRRMIMGNYEFGDIY